ncbi:MAG TPA: chemotaxis protein CheD [Thermoanaerobaculia bacterium]|jgi:chemotaxis protein CheD|nr:chemotaxis protein CheD [Thermoanaerobaculia bacterium]
MTALNPTVMTSNSGASQELRTVYLYPGQVYTASQPLIVSTILGSCVSVCLWDATASIAGINHYLLPRSPVRGQSDLRYGNTAIERLIDEMLTAGAVMQRIIAKVVGGASILGNGSETRQSIGDQNVEVARQILQKHAIPVSAEQTGGKRGRKLVFHTGTGQAYSKEI